MSFSIQPNKPVYGIILAAGKGTRMKSDLPKVLHPFKRKPLIEHVINAADAAGLDHMTVVVGYGKEQVIETVEKISNKRGLKINFALQEEQKGTGHAVLCTEGKLPGVNGIIVVLLGDVPLLKAETVQKAIDYMHGSESDAIVITMTLNDPTGYGRIVRNERDQVTTIVEEKDADESERHIREVNTGIFIFNNSEVYDLIKKINDNNSQGEYYLTDIVGIMLNNDMKLSAYKAEEPEQFKGVNSVEQLKELEKSAGGA